MGKTTTALDIRYTLSVEQDDMPVRGNALASGADAADKAAEDEIIARLEAGDVWAWAQVTVRAELTLNEQTYHGYDYLGACSYADEDDFKAGVYYPDMEGAAYMDLVRNLRELAHRGVLAEQALEQLDGVW
jgi:hypothetical protein